MTHLEYLELSAKTLALFHTGSIKLKCSSCVRQEELNCDMLDEIDAQYYNPDLGTIPFCPVRLLTTEHYDWYDEHFFNKEYGIQISYDDTNYFEWYFIKTYLKYYNEYVNRTPEKSNDQGKKQANLNQFRKISEARNGTR